MSLTIPVGPFEIHARVAQGGMGEIWRGVHRAQGVPVALKVMTGEAMKDARYYEEFRREVQAAARLAHPNVAMVFEYGAIPPEAARASAGGLVANSPYIVMEWAARGSLDDHGRPQTWRELRQILLTLLDALAHAHARGVIHRDLKPGNVLIADSGPIGRAIRLSDFGIARAQPREDEQRPREGDMSGLTEAPAGTPYYMAPEQVFGRFRDYGPWTDLYALGIVAWELACGELPFVSENLMGVLYQQLEEPVPPLRARFPVPHDFEGWIRRVTEKSPRARFRYAADAAWALSGLGEAPTPMTSMGSDLGPRARTQAAFDETLPSMSVAPSLDAQHVSSPAVPLVHKRARPLLELAIESDDDRVPPQPASWADAAHAPPSMRLVGAGLGLWALRSVPMVDRSHERDAVWEELRAVRLERSPRAIVLRGTGGCGKSRLAEWLIERAHELGAAEPLTTSHQAVPDRRQGLARLVERHHRLVGLDAERTLTRLEEQLRADGVEDAYEWRALGGIVVGEDSSRTSFAPTTPGERNVLVTRLLERLARHRPAIVWLDDVQWGEASLAFVQGVLAAQGSLPVLFVLTARDEALEERPRERQLLAAIESIPSTRTIRIGSLPDPDLRMLTEHLLGLSAELAHQIQERVHGNPLFALQLVGDWIDKGLLEIGEHGFVLRAGAHTELPDDLHVLWLGRVEQVLAGRSSLARMLVELAAVLGHDVDAGEFARACIALGHRFPGDLLEPLILHRLIVPSHSGWSFAHGLLRESLVRSAREGGRLETLHRACALMLEADVAVPGIAERLAHHLLAANELERALEPLLAAARHRLAISEIEAALLLIAEHERALATLGMPPTDLRAIESAIVRADAHRQAWEFDRAESVAQAALDAATRVGAQRERAESLALLAHCARQRGDLALAMTRNRTAFGLFDRVDDPRGRARCLLAMAILARQQSEMPRARELYERAAAVFETIDDDTGRANALLGLGNLHRAAQRFDEAKPSYMEARALFERLGNQGNLAHCVNGLAEVARFEGDLDAAERGYREVLRIQTAIGSKASFIPRMNLALVLLARRDFVRARAELEVVLAYLERGTQRGYLGSTHALLLPCAAAARDAEGFDRHLAAASQLLTETTTNDPDIASASELAGRAWTEAGDRERGRAALAIAIAQWTALGDKPRADALRVLVDRL